MKKPFIALIFPVVKQAMRLVLVIAAASLFFSCGSGNPELKPATETQASKSLSLSLSLSPASAVQCSDVATIAAGAISYGRA